MIFDGGAEISLVQVPINPDSPAKSPPINPVRKYMAEPDMLPNKPPNNADIGTSKCESAYQALSVQSIKTVNKQVLNAVNLLGFKM